MSFAHECKCGVVNPVPESQRGRRVRCKGCGSIAVVAPPESLPVSVGSLPADSTPPPASPNSFEDHQPFGETGLADYPRVGGLIDWRQVCDEPAAPPAIDPQMRHILPDAPPARRAVWIIAGVLSVLLALVGVAASAWGSRVAYGAFPVFAAGCLLIGRGLRGKWY